MKLLLLATLVLIVLPVLLLAGGFAANRPPLLDPPGVAQRLATYLTTNVAMTASESWFPELELPLFEVNSAMLLKAVEQACVRLGWQVDSVDPGESRLTAVVTTSLFRFKDDVYVQAVPHGEHGTALQVRSASRVGKGDLAANARHILDLVAQVRVLLRKPSNADNPR